MISNNYLSVLTTVLLLICSSCGGSNDSAPVVINGHLDISAIEETLSGPLFVAVLDTMPADFNTTGMDSIISILSVDSDTCTFRINMSSSTSKPGDTVFITAFEDKDFNGIPSVSEGDVIGFYSDPQTIKPGYYIENTNGSEIEIHVNREVFSFDATLSGTVSGNTTGPVTIFAYAGEINSLDFLEFNALDIIGYTTLEKSSYSESFTLTILPYGHNVPVENVFLFAVVDVNGNSVNDAGDIIGYIQNDQGLPGLLTIAEGDKNGLDIDLLTEIPTPSGYTMTISGEFEVAEPFVGNSGETFVIVSESDSSDRGNIRFDFSTVRYFSKLPDDIRSFDIDLSATSILPGDDVMVTILYDNDYHAGFPSVSEGDYLGYYQNTENFRTYVTLTEGNTSVKPGSGWEFEVNREFYDHDATIEFELDDSALKSIWVGERLDPGEHVTALAVHEDGVTIGINPSIDMDYVIGTVSLTVPDGGNEGYFYTMNVLPAIYHAVTVGDPFSIHNVYILAVFDGNISDSPEKNNYMGYYWKWSGLIRQITPYPQIHDGENVLDRSVRFSTLKYTF